MILLQLNGFVKARSILLIVANENAGVKSSKILQPKAEILKDFCSLDGLRDLSARPCRGRGGPRRSQGRAPQMETQPERTHKDGAAKYPLKSDLPEAKLTTEHRFSLCILSRPSPSCFQL
jgi:hypothetical protein